MDPCSFPWCFWYFTLVMLVFFKWLFFHRVVNIFRTITLIFILLACQHLLLLLNWFCNERCLFVFKLGKREIHCWFVLSMTNDSQVVLVGIYDLDIVLDTYKLFIYWSKCWLKLLPLAFLRLRGCTDYFFFAITLVHLSCLVFNILF